MTTQADRAGAIGVHVQGFLARCDTLRGPGQSRVDRCGLHGVFSSDDPSSTRLVIDNDQALDALREMLAHTPGGMMNVLATAPRAAALLERHERGGAAETATAMVTLDLRRCRPRRFPQT